MIRTNVLAGCLVLSFSLGALADEAALNAARESVLRDDLRKLVTVLAADALEGREAGSAGGRAAGAYLMQEFTRLGLAGAGDAGGYVQAFNGSFRNILGLLEGTDAELKQEIILIGAHYDHVGYGTRRNSRGPTGYIHNGADDNASGVSGLVEIAEAFSQHGGAKRSLLFCLWDSEEAGLLGSKHWVASPTIPLERIKLAINLDMIGRMQNGNVDAYGTRSAVGLRRLISRANDGVGLNMSYTWEMKENSDHWPFYNRRIPIIMLHTGLHEDYHRPGDDTEKINFEGAEQVSRVLVNIVGELAGAAQLPAYRADSRRENPDSQRAFERPHAPAPGRLGLTWQAGETTEGLAITQVAAGSAAAEAGVRPGDRITKLNDEPITDGDAFREQIVTGGPTVTLEAVRSGEKEPLKLEVTLRGSPVRVGISWIWDPAQPDELVVTRVISGSPADRAGVKVGDRIEQFGEETPRDNEQIMALATTLASPIKLHVERRGNRSIIEINTPVAPAATAAK